MARSSGDIEIAFTLWRAESSILPILIRRARATSLPAVVDAIIARAQREAGLRRRGGEAAERSRGPEALPNFVRRRQRRRERKCRANGRACQEVRPKPAPRFLRSHVCP